MIAEIYSRLKQGPQAALWEHFFGSEHHEPKLNLHFISTTFNIRLDNPLNNGDFLQTALHENLMQSK